MRCRQRGPLQHLRHLRLGQRLGQHLPRLGRLDVDGGIVMNAPVEQQPLVKSRAGSSACAPPSAHRCRDCADVRATPPRRPARRQQQHVAALEKLGKDAQIAQVGFAGERAKPFLHAKIVAVILQKRKLVSTVHITDYRRLEVRARPCSGGLPYHVQYGINIINMPSVTKRLTASAGFRQTAARDSLCAPPNTAQSLQAVCSSFPERNAT